MFLTSYTDGVEGQNWTNTIRKYKDKGYTDEISTNTFEIRHPSKGAYGDKVSDSIVLRLRDSKPISKISGRGFKNRTLKRYLNKTNIFDNINNYKLS